MLMMRIVVLLAVVGIATGFHTSKAFRENLIHTRSQQALKTAGNEFSGFIPRLEPGLRILRTTKYIFGADPTELSSFSLELLKSLSPHPLISLGDVDSVPKNIVPLEKLFASAKNFFANLTMRFFKYVKSVVASALIITTTLASKPIEVPSFARSAAVVTGGALTALTVGPRSFVANAMIGGKKYQSLNPYQKLGTTPVYYVGNSRGNAFLQEDIQAGKPEQKIIVYFMSYDDAASYLEEMAQSNPQNAHEFSIVTASMEKVMDQITAKKQSRKLGRIPMETVYRIQPSAKQSGHAERLAGSGVKGMTIPMFSAPGLVLQRANGEVVTPYYFSFEDLEQDWNKMLTTLKDQPLAVGAKLPAEKPKVVVRDFTDVMCLSGGISRQSVEGTSLESLAEALASAPSKVTVSKQLSKSEIKAALETPGVVPPREEIDLVKSFYRHQAGVPGEFSKSKLFARAG